MAVPVPVLSGGLFLRYVDANNYLRATIRRTTGGTVVYRCEIVKRVASTNTFLGELDASVSSGAIDLTAVAHTSGRWYVEMTDGSSRWTLTGADSDLATGGALASGRFGLYDNQPDATASTRTYDTFAAWVPPADAAVFAAQSLEIRNDRVIREDSAGAIWTKPSSYEGDYLLVPPTGPDARTTRFIVKASRNVPGQGADSGTDDISARLTYTPRYLVVPGY